MKKKEFLLGFFAMAMALVLSASFVSCGDDDDDKKTENNDGDPGDPGDEDSDDDDPDYTIYRAPYTTWGADAATVKAYMKDYTLDEEYSEDEYLDLYYDGKDKEYEIGYEFSNDKLVESWVYVMQDQTTLSALTAKLADDGYVYNSDYNDTIKVFFSKDETTMVMLMTSEYFGDYSVYYYENEVESEATWKDPYITWGASKTAVKNYMSGYEMIVEDDELIGYEGKDDEDSYWYFFDSAKLVESYVDIPQEVASLDDIYTKLKGDGYSYLGVKPDTVFHFISADQATYVFLVAMDYYGVNELEYVDCASLSSSRSMSGQTAGPAKLNYADFKREKKLAAPKAAKAVKGSKASFNLKKAVLRKAMR